MVIRRAFLIAFRNYCACALTDFPNVSGNLIAWLFLSIWERGTDNGMSHRNPHYLPTALAQMLRGIYKTTSAKASRNYAWQQVNFLEVLKSQDFSFKIHL